MSDTAEPTHAERSAAAASEVLAAYSQRMALEPGLGAHVDLYHLLFGLLSLCDARGLDFDAALSQVRADCAADPTGGETAASAALLSGAGRVLITLDGAVVARCATLADADAYLGFSPQIDNQRLVDDDYTIAAPSGVDDDDAAVTLARDSRFHLFNSMGAAYFTDEAAPDDMKSWSRGFDTLAAAAHEVNYREAMLAAMADPNNRIGEAGDYRTLFFCANLRCAEAGRIYEIRPDTAGFTLIKHGRLKLSFTGEAADFWARDLFATLVWPHEQPRSAVVDSWCRRFDAEDGWTA